MSKNVIYRLRPFLPFFRSARAILSIIHWEIYDREQDDCDSDYIFIDLAFRIGLKDPRGWI